MSVRSLFARADAVLAQRYPFVLPALGYDVKAIEPAIDAQTMTIHHDRHHAAIRNNGGGHANHALYWELLAPGSATSAAPSGQLSEMIVRDFSTLDACKAALKAAGLAQFGSGWAWLVKTATSRLVVRGLPNQDSPLLEGELPIIGLDVWEHAYYLRYQNRRADYLDALLARLNWDVASAQLRR